MRDKQDPGAHERRRTRGGREVPHNLEAEESLLGAMMLSSDAIRAAKDGVDAVDFYKPAHVAIFEAIVKVYDAGGIADPVAVAAELEQDGLLDSAGGRRRLVELQANTPASANAGYYAKIVDELAIARRAIHAAGDLAEVGYEADLDEIDRVAASIPDLIARRAIAVATDDLVDLWALAAAEQEKPSKPWVIPACLRIGEVYVLTGSEGGGKMMYLRQCGTCVAAGIHPFTGLSTGMERHRVLAIDLQEDRVDQAAELAKLSRAVGDWYEPGWYRSVSWPTGVNLLSSRGRRMVEGAIEDARPELVVLGPLVNAFRAPAGASRHGEDVVEEVTGVLNDLMHRYGFALMLEAHAGNNRSSDEDWRVRGSSVWRSWPAFSHGLKVESMAPREATIVRARPDRYAGRAWPHRVFEHPSKKLPWSCSEGDYEAVARAMGLGWLIDGAEQTTIDIGDEPF